MNASLWKKVILVSIALPVIGLVVANSSLTVGQDKASDKKAPKTEKTTEKAKGRLPAYYADVVDEAQREKIYNIQAKYADQLKALNDQLAALNKKLDGEVEAVLTAEQKAKVEKARADAADKKKKKAAEKSKTEGDKKGGTEKPADKAK